jgi:NAD+ diphosphatase
VELGDPNSPQVRRGVVRGYAAASPDRELCFARLFLPAQFTPLWSPPPDPRPGEDYWFLFHAGKLLVVEGVEGAPEIPKRSDSGVLPLTVADAHCIGALNGRLCWAAESSGPFDELPTGYGLESLRSLFGRLSEAWLAVAGRALQVIEFGRTHRYCGGCATPTESHDQGRARRCPTCGGVAYPRIAPAMMVLIKRDTDAGRELLLARGARFPGAFYSALAGFVEPSESVEDCIHRETREEVGVRVRNLRYFGSQSWPFPHSLMVAFLADYDSGEIICQLGEILDAQWFPLDRLPPLPGPVSIARRLINHAVAEVAPDHPALATK